MVRALAALGRGSFAWIVAVCVSVAPAAGQSLQNRIDQLLTDPKLGDTRTGVVVLDPQTGRTIASRNADESFIPASNMKLITSGSALSFLGPEFTFRTELIFDAQANEGAGRIVLRGSGDPALADPKLLQAMKMQVDDLLNAWVDALRNAGLRPGAELVIDDRIFDRQYTHPTWPAQQLNRWYCAEVAGVNFHTNILTVFTEPQEEGRAPRLSTQPVAPWMSLKNKARSVKKGNHTAWASREAGNQITIFGDVRWASDPVEVALNDNPSFVGRLIADRLSGAGLAPSATRLAEENEDLSGGRVVHVVTTDLETVLRRCNVDSYNLYAEALIKRMGAEMAHSPGSWSNGAALVRMVLLERLGPEAGHSLMVADGSGMSRENRVTPRMLAAWLKSMIDDPRIGTMFYDSLPVAAEEGTLRRRFGSGALRNEVRAKTGYLTGVSAISGYITDPQTGRRVIFSVITNDKPNRVPVRAVRDVEEKIVHFVDDWMSGRR